MHALRITSGVVRNLTHSADFAFQMAWDAILHAAHWREMQHFLRPLWSRRRIRQKPYWNTSTMAPPCTSTTIESQPKKMGFSLLAQNVGSSHLLLSGNSKRSRRFFWVQNDELCWGRAKSDAEVQNVNLKECLGIVYGTLELPLLDLIFGLTSANWPQIHSWTINAISCYFILQHMYIEYHNI